MPLTQLELFQENNPPLSFGKTCPASSTQKTTPSAASWDSLLAQTLPSRPTQADGRARVMLLAPKGKRRGECLTLNTSESPNDVAESSLSQVLEREIRSRRSTF